MLDNRISVGCANLKCVYGYNNTMYVHNIYINLYSIYKSILLFVNYIEKDSEIQSDRNSFTSLHKSLRLEFRQKRAESVAILVYANGEALFYKQRWIIIPHEC